MAFRSPASPGTAPLLMRSLEAADGNAYFLGTLPGPGSSSLARDGVVMFALLQRALNEGAARSARRSSASPPPTALGGDPAQWHRRRAGRTSDTRPANLPLRAGVVAGATASSR